ncbi:hypothetical protein DNTS_019030 [Danionella cerebrum]|uniref:RRM domain-containing protein n=1 Tax=Danionella cerebrum TaxID=2873325 RepID=A0A553Q4T6_9TELE|nr:hypothetical protein DNTS_019030 [Danionella translucida]
MSVLKRSSFLFHLARFVRGQQRFTCAKTLKQIKTAQVAAARGCNVHSWTARCLLFSEGKHPWTLNQKRQYSEAPPTNEDYLTLEDNKPSDGESGVKEEFFVLVEGLHWTCTKQDLMDFFFGCSFRGQHRGIAMLYHAGRLSGQAFIELETKEDVQKALGRNGHFLKQRYIDVKEVTYEDAETILRKEKKLETDGVVQLRGIPFNSTESDIIVFFSGLKIVENGVRIVRKEDGRPSGYAFVEFATKNIAEEAQLRNRQYMEASLRENKPLETDGVVQLRGIPSKSTESDIIDFFSGLEIVENGVTIVRKEDGTPSGYAFVEFATKNIAEEAQYIEIIPSNKSAVMSQFAHQRWKPTAEHISHKTEASLRENKPLEMNGVVQLRGIPFNSTESDIIDFFSGLEIVENGVTIVRKEDGRPSGYAFVEFATKNIAEEAQYIEIIPSNKSAITSQFEASLRENKPLETDGVVQLRGIPFNSTESDIIDFFSGLEIVENGVTIVRKEDGTPSGYAFVEFATKNIAEEAQYIEIIPSNKSAVTSQFAHLRWKPTAEHISHKTGIYYTLLL